MRAFCYKLFILCNLPLLFGGEVQAGTAAVSKADSLFFHYNKLSNDTSKVNRLNAVFWEYLDSDFDKARKVLDQSLQIAQNLQYKKGIAQCYHCLGVWNYYNDDYKNAMAYYLKSLAIKENAEENMDISSTLNNMGILHRLQNNLTDALKYYKQALEIDSKNNDQKGVAAILNNIGSVYLEQKDFVAANEYYKRSLAIRKQLKDVEGMASSYNNIGLAFEQMQNYEKALEFYQLSLSHYTRLDDTYGICTACYNVATAHAFLGREAEALELFNKTLSYSFAAEYKIMQRDSYKALADLYFKKKNYETAYTFLLRHTLLKDSILNEENLNQINNLEAKYQNVKKQKEIEELENKRKLQSIELAQKDALVSKQTTIRNAFIIGFVLAMVAAFFIFQGYKQKNAANKLLSWQKVQLAEKNKEITDSIYYAKNIQNAIIPSEEQLKKYLPESFVLFKPKDVVSGDFYWFSPLGGTTVKQKQIESGELLFAVADCTGHGVPGAFMSLISYQSLREAVNTFFLKQPAEILNSCTRSIHHTLHEKLDHGGIKDGMDIALCHLSKKDMMLNYAGAINSIYIIRKREFPFPEKEIAVPLAEYSTLENFLFEVDGDKQSIGQYASEEQQSYTQKSIRLYPGDRLYLFSDGYADQFGGPRGKKFKYRQLKQLLLEHAGKNMEEQKKILERVFYDWKGNLEQVDDICLMGISI